MTQNDLRQIVRDVLREVVAQRGQPANAPTAIEPVRIASDADLMAFARRAIEAQAAIASGALRFSLAGSAAASVPPVVTAPAPGSVLSGVVTEAMINRNAGAGRITLGPDAVVTPLARDRARQLNLKLERSR
jgi:hypothetical protein